MISYFEKKLFWGLFLSQIKNIICYEFFAIVLSKMIFVFIHVQSSIKNLEQTHLIKKSSRLWRFLGLGCLFRSLLDFLIIYGVIFYQNGLSFIYQNPNDVVVIIIIQQDLGQSIKLMSLIQKLRWFFWKLLLFVRLLFFHFLRLRLIFFLLDLDFFRFCH